MPVMTKQRLMQRFGCTEEQARQSMLDTAQRVNALADEIDAARAAGKKTFRGYKTDAAAVAIVRAYAAQFIDAANA